MGTATRSALAGLVSGALVGGVGSRIAMRISTMMGGIRDSTLGETLAYIGVVGLLGGVVGLVLGLLGRRWKAPWWAVGLLTGVLVFVAIRIEGNWPALFTEGSPIVNLVLWFAVGFGYGALWHRLAQPEGAVPA